MCFISCHCVMFAALLSTTLVSRGHSLSWLLLLLLMCSYLPLSAKMAARRPPPPQNVLTHSLSHPPNGGLVRSVERMPGLYPPPPPPLLFHYTIETLVIPVASVESVWLQLCQLFGQERLVTALTADFWFGCRDDGQMVCFNTTWLTRSCCCYC